MTHERQAFDAIVAMAQVVRGSDGRRKMAAPSQPHECWFASLELRPQPQGHDDEPCWPPEIVTRKSSDSGTVRSTRSDAVRRKFDGTYPTPRRFAGPFL